MNAARASLRRLGDVCRVQKGTTITEKQATSGPVPVIAGGIKPAYYHDVSNRAPGAVTISASGYAGYVSYWSVPIWASDCITVEPLDADSAEPSYLFHALKYIEPTVLQAMQRGAAQKHVYVKDVQEVKLFLPPIEEQRRIASILDAADALRTKRRQALAKLNTLTQAIFIDMFGDPVSNRRCWPTVPLSDFGDLDRGVSKHRPRNDPDLLGGRWPLIQTGDVSNSGGYITTSTATYSDRGLAQSKIWPKGTLCITIAANIAKTGILTFDACFPDSIVGFTSQEDHRTEYVRAFMRFLQPVLELQAPESAQKNINLKVLRNLAIPMPPDEQVRMFSANVSTVTESTRGIAGQSARLNCLLTSLQHRAFRGEL